ncbi:hypothetical protein [Gandjariella thermophila]|uniref:IrrE N-terminal-like domain-containing protein n=1 Tax=Gandjariella thermophila TaxID=1931992 RepID=A0A4D4JBG6_9PSEU|nr:hypothetical protein GTS_33620 [Gandjariella thermophila]
MSRLGQSLRRRATESRLRRRLRRELAALHIEGPTDMADVCARLSERRGKPIRLLAYPLEVPGPFGLWLNTPSADYVLYQAETTRLHQEHIIAHELGHLLADHPSDEDDDAVWRELMPDIPPELIRRALRRTSYDTEHEREAETVATMLLESAAVAGYVPDTAHTPRAKRAQRALGDRQDWL